MATAICMFMLFWLAFIVTPLVGRMNHGSLHRIDLMAGGEGID